MSVSVGVILLLFLILFFLCVGHASKFAIEIKNKITNKRETEKPGGYCFGRIA